MVHLIAQQCRRISKHDGQEHTPSGRVQDYREFSVKCTVGAIVNPVALLLQVLHD
jgi:hypothetical protein